ncbi:hypothetical protein CCR75_008728 [Bremia lactucae]|uniref:ACB domain-containing protein n=1 Tax=Bremia lactucae TaxID=4779 RepID=A0A976FMQ9_BRELC|nr:hypothetical protein CCR75_008728 [Bremia lactucae]
MYFCSGPPRTYAASATHERIEDVALSMHPSQRVFARVSASSVALWSALPELPGTGRRQLAHCHRSGQWIDQQLKLTLQKNDPNDGVYLYESETRQLWATWVSGNRLAVVEKHSQFVEFYTFEGLAQLLQRAEAPSIHLPGDDVVDANIILDQPIFTDPEQEEGDGQMATSEVFQLQATFVEDYPLNQGSSQNDYDDVAASMSGVCGSKFVFVGMASGLICVVEVAEGGDTRDGQKSWFRTAEQSTKLWKIDVRTHLKVPHDPKKLLSCIGLTCATSDSYSTITSLNLVATFAGGTCFMVVLSPCTKKINQLLSLVNATRKNADGKSDTGCTTTKLNPMGSKLALGWSDGRVSLFRVSFQRKPRPAPTKPPSQNQQAPSVLTLTPLRELNLAPWGYQSNDVGHVTTLAWSHNGQSIAVGYALRGFALFAIDGCRLMSSFPHHHQERLNDVKQRKEMCAFGVLALQWTHESTSLLVVPRGEQFKHVVDVPLHTKSGTETRITHAQLYTRTTISIRKSSSKGLGLSFSGTPNRCGAWIQSYANLSQEVATSIQKDDLLVGINTLANVVNLPFQRIIRVLKDLPTDEIVTLTFVRLEWESVFYLAVQVLTSSTFLTAQKLPLQNDENLCIQEYALRMQALQGNCVGKNCPSFIEKEQRAKCNGWEALHGMSTREAQYKYVKLLFALFPKWNPMHIVTLLTTSWKQTLETDLTTSTIVVSRQLSSMALAEFDFATLVNPRASQLVLIERNRLRFVGLTSFDDPCALTSCITYNVPFAFEKYGPIRLVASSTSGKHVAIAGQRGFCVLNVDINKWRMFGNILDEHDIVVSSMVWINEDVILAAFTRESEAHTCMYLYAYARNQLTTESVLAKFVIPLQSKEESFWSMESDKQHVFGWSLRYIWWFQVLVTGSIKDETIAVTLELQRQIKFPSWVVEAQRQEPGTLHIAILPRGFTQFVPTTQQQRLVPLEPTEDETHWLTDFVNRLVHGQIPEQYVPDQVLPRFIVLSTNGDVIVWDPENRSQRLVCSNISTMTRLIVTPQSCAVWPTSCRLLFGLYGPDGMHLYLPLLDGVYLTQTKTFEHDFKRLETFLACHDPLRAKTYEIEFGTAPATAELYEHVMREYGIELDLFRRGTTNGLKSLQDGYMNQRGCVMSVDDPSGKDSMLQFDVDVQVLGIEPTFGLLVGISQDVYGPSGVVLPCYDVFTRVQPLFHTLLCYLVQNDQLSWARQVLMGIRTQFALATVTQELFLYSILEACNRHECSVATVDAAIALLQYHESECCQHRVEYCEIIAHVARKIEPSRLSLLFPAAGDPIALLKLCQERSELRTAANFLLIVDECSSEIHSSLSVRTKSAATLLEQCIDQDEWTLAQHVARVARDWHQPDCSSTERSGGNVDEQLALIAFKLLGRGEYERVVACVEKLQTKLPIKPRMEWQLLDERDSIVDRLTRTFIQSNKRRQLRILLQAVTEAHYDDWIAIIQFVMEQ